MATHEATARLYVAADLAPSGGIVQQYSLQTLAPIAPKTFANRVLALAVNGDGTRLFAVVAGATAADDATLEVLDTTTPAAFSGASLASVAIPDSADADGNPAPACRRARLASLAVTALRKSVVQLWDVSGIAPTAWSPVLRNRGRDSAVGSALGE